MSRERASLAEALASEMVSRLEIMAKDVHMLAKKVTFSFLPEALSFPSQSRAVSLCCRAKHTLLCILWLLPYLVLFLPQCKELCIDVQDQFLRELRDLSEVRAEFVSANWLALDLFLSGLISLRGYSLPRDVYCKHCLMRVP